MGAGGDTPRKEGAPREPSDWLRPESLPLSSTDLSFVFCRLRCKGQSAHGRPLLLGSGARSSAWACLSVQGWASPSHASQQTRALGSGIRLPALRNEKKMAWR
ncbi:Serine--Trna Ligase, Cytoplasmic [Manis pentadactyla]|nr:Serine--Trna Ligase, Cytoplasmic [Manis pentadactyla]